MKRLYEKDFQSLLPLANQGDPSSQYKIGWMLYKGWAVKKDFAEAMKWFRRAADQGYLEAQHTLGALYWSGHAPRQDGVKVTVMQPDLVEAYKWLNIVAATRQFKEGWLLELTAKMTPEQIAEGKRLLAEWKPAPDPNKTLN